jgi:hypothetical protein
MPLAIGRGLDRATGLAATQPQYPSDARNVYARDAKMAVRPGLAGTGYPELGWGTDHLALIGVKATYDLLYVIYDRVSRVVRVARLNPSTGVLQTLSAPVNGVWGTLNINAEFPVVSYDEADGRIVLAHDEANISYRLPTIYYTPNFASPEVAGTLSVVTADLDGDGISGTVYFRGVRKHLEYMCGWGYGTESDPDRGDTMRASKAGDPTVWAGANYVNFGVKREAIIAAKPVDNVLAVAKNVETWIMEGATASQFRPKQIDANYGAVSSRSMVAVGGRVFMRSDDGPRQVTVNATIPIGQSLELISPLPATLPARGPSRECFAVYDILRYLVEWIWPDTDAGVSPVLSEALSLWDPADPRWTFMVREQPLSCAGILYGQDFGGAAPAPLGYVSSIAAVDV